MHLLCVCLNKIYILNFLSFSPFSCLLSNIAHQSSLAGTSWRDAPSPQAGWNVGLFGQEAGRTGGGRGAGRQTTGLRQLAGPARSGWLFGWSLGLGSVDPKDTQFPATPPPAPATSTGQTTAGAYPRIRGQVSCPSWAHLPLGPLLFPPPRGLEEPGGQRSEEARRSNFEAVLLP